MTALDAFVPLVHSEMVAAGERVRAEPATLVFADIAGFTALNERLMKRGREGAEIMVAVLDDVFGSLLNEAERWGGDLLKFGGDAILLMLTGDEHLGRATNLAHSLGARFSVAARRTRSSQAVRLGISIGLETGTPLLLSCGDDGRELVVAGPAVDGVLAAESAASAGEVRVGPVAAAQLGLDPAVPIPLLSRPAHCEPIALGPPLGGVGRRCLNGSIATHLAGDPDAADHRRVAAAFVSFSVSTGLWAGDPGALLDVVDPMVRHAQQVAGAHGVTLMTADVGVGGGKLFLVAGAPTSSGDNVDRALSSSIEIVRHEFDGVRLRAGVNHGVVFASAIGSDRQRAYCVTGDTVNTAARIAGAAELGEVLAAGSIVGSTREEFRYEDRPSFVGKGKSAPIAVVSADAPSASRHRRDTDGTSAVGRAAEVEEILGLWTDAADGAFRLVEVVADGGMGKSRLVAAVVDQLGAVGVITLRGSPLASASAFFALSAGLRRALFDVEEPTVQDLASLVDTVAPHLAVRLPLLAIALGIAATSTPEVDELAPEFREQLLRSATVDLLRAAFPRPVPLVIEDAHWLDDSTAGVLDHLVSTAPGGWLILVTRRFGSSGWNPTSTGVRRLELVALDDDSASELVRGAPGGTSIDPHRLRAIVARANGNPLFLLSLATSTTASDDLPATIEEALQAELDRIPPAVRHTVGLAAVVGMVGDVALLSAIESGGGAGVTTLEDATGFVEMDGDRFRFTHALRRDVAYQALSFRERRTAHAAAAVALVERGDPSPALLSLHFWEARDLEAAWRWSRLAADQAREAFSVTTEATFLDRATQAARALGRTADPDYIEVLERWGDALEIIGRFDEAVAALRRAATSTESPDVRARLFTKVARQYEFTAEIGRGVRWARRAERLAAESGAASAARIEPLRQLGALAFRRAEFDVSLAAYEEAADLAARSRDSRQRAEALRMIGTIAELQGRSGIGELSRAARTLERLGQLQRASSALVNLGAAYYDRGDWNRSVEAYSRCSVQANRIGDLVLAATADNNIAEIQSDRGRTDEAITILEACLATWTGCDYSIGVAVATANIGRAHRRSGRTELADEMLRTAERVFGAMNADDFVEEVRLRRAECALAMGDVDGARDLLRSCAALAGDVAPDGGGMASSWARISAIIALHDGDIGAFGVAIGRAGAIAKAHRLGYLELLSSELVAIVDGRASLMERSARRLARLDIDDSGQRQLLPNGLLTDVDPD